MPVGWSSTYADAYAVSAMGAGLVGCNAGGRWMEDASEDLWNIKKRACGLMWSPLLYLILETCLWIDVVSFAVVSFERACGLMWSPCACGLMWSPLLLPRHCLILVCMLVLVC
jgi:hypothetical protein